MRKLVAILVMLIASSVSSVKAEAQILPGDGNCWSCLLNGGNPENPPPSWSCVGVSSGAFECHVDQNENVCWTVGAGCSTGLFAASGAFEGLVACSSLTDVTEVEWYARALDPNDTAISDRVADSAKNPLIDMSVALLNP
jgi:hypothetical protein